MAVYPTLCLRGLRRYAGGGGVCVGGGVHRAVALAASFLEFFLGVWPRHLTVQCCRGGRGYHARVCTYI